MCRHETYQKIKMELQNIQKWRLKIIKRKTFLLTGESFNSEKSLSEFQWTGDEIQKLLEAS